MNNKNKNKGVELHEDILCPCGCGNVLLANGSKVSKGVIHTYDCAKKEVFVRFAYPLCKEVKEDKPCGINRSKKKYSIFSNGDDNDRGMGWFFRVMVKRVEGMVETSTCGCFVSGR